MVSIRKVARRAFVPQPDKHAPALSVSEHVNLGKRKSPPVPSIDVPTRPKKAFCKLTAKFISQNEIFVEPATPSPLFEILDGQHEVPVGLSTPFVPSVELPTISWDSAVEVPPSTLLTSEGHRVTICADAREEELNRLKTKIAHLEKDLAFLWENLLDLEADKLKETQEMSQIRAHMAEAKADQEKRNEEMAQLRTDVAVIKADQEKKNQKMAKMRADLGHLAVAKAESQEKEKATSPKQSSFKGFGKKVMKALKGKDNPEKDKLQPSDAELRKTICGILREVDLGLATFTDILVQLDERYKTDLAPQKSSIKLLIQEEFTKLAVENSYIYDEVASNDKPFL